MGKSAGGKAVVAGQIGANKADAGAGRGRADHAAHGLAAMQADAFENDGRAECVLKDRRCRQV